jgi:hypothetical protein
MHRTTLASLRLAFRRGGVGGKCSEYFGVAEAELGTSDLKDQYLSFLSRTNTTCTHWMLRVAGMFTARCLRRPPLLLLFYRM